ncbi:MAG: iron ABC transporter permease [Fibrobacter sp.]|nr:iron ABC transporter permease [Fibrobacter sp.]
MAGTLCIGPVDLDSDMFATVLWKLRVPRLVAAVLAGAALSVSGLSLQTLFRNPLAGPFVLGISNGASLGVALALLAGFSFGNFGVLTAASLGALAVTVIIFWIASKFERNSVLLVAGLLIGYFIDALVSLLIAGSDAESLRMYISWGMGSFGRLTPSNIWIFAVAVAVGLLLIVSCLRYLNGARLGDDFARGLGLSVAVQKKCVLLGASILAAAVTAFCGPVAFIGIAVPHLTYLLFHTTNHRVLIPGVMLCGADLALLAGLFPTIPLNATLSIVGVPVILWVLLRSGREGRL